MDSAFQDERFSHVSKDPRFRSVPKKERKVKIDKRFQGMFKDERFKLKYSVDKKGRPANKTSDEDLKRFYELSEESDTDLSATGSEDESENIETHKTQLAKPKKKTLLKNKSSDKNVKSGTKNTDKSIEDKGSGISKSTKEKKLQKNETRGSKVRKQLKDNDEDSLSEESENEQVWPGRGQANVSIDSDHQESSESGVGTGPDLARGEGNVSSSDDEGSDDHWMPQNENEIDHKWGEADENVPVSTELGRRLAVCNMDWDKIKARDLYVLFSSFKPAGGIIHSVTVYPSEYGMKMMQEENTKGPANLINDDTGDKTKDEGSEYHNEKLRQYQLNRLKYYYAVLECDSIETANRIYEECDGLEYETSSAKLDLRYIPDDMEFDQEPHAVCKETPDSGTFEPSMFLTTALCQSTVELTWDETDRDRSAVTRKKISADDVKDDDFKAYLASSSDEETDPYKGLVDESESGEDDEDDDEETKIQKYKCLMKDLEESEKQKEDRGVEMEITWEPGLKETTEEIVKKKSSKKELSVWEQYLDRKKEKKRKKQEEKMKDRLSRKTDSNQVEEDVKLPVTGGEAFSDDDLPDDIDMNDPYFKSEMGDGRTDKTGSKKKKDKKQKVKLTAAEQEEITQKQAELSLLMMDEEDVEKREHFSLQKLMKSEKKKKNRKRRNEPEDLKSTEDTFKFNIDDSRFKAMYSSHLYNIDPSVPEFKRTKVMDTIINEKLKRRKQPKKGMDTDNLETNTLNTQSIDPVTDKGKSATLKSNSQKHTKDPTISALVSSVKSKTKNYYKNKLK